MTVISGGSDDVSQYQPPVDNSEDERRAQEEADRLAKEKEEADRVAREEAEKLRKQREFAESKKQTIGSLKSVGSGETKIKSATTIKDNSTGFGLKGVGDTGIKDVRPDKSVRDFSGRQSAWKELNATAYLIGKSAANSDPSEAAYLADQAFRAANGDPLGVAVPAAPPLPTWPPDKATTPEYRAVRKILAEQLRQGTKIIAEKQQKLNELTKAKVKASAELKTAREKVELLRPAPAVTTPISSVATTTPPEPVVAKSKAMAEAEAALAAAEQAEADANRVQEAAEAEVKADQSKLNNSIRTLTDVEIDPNLAPSILAKLPTAPTK